MRTDALRFVASADPAWTRAEGEDGPQPHPAPRPSALLTLAQWHAVQAQWPADLPVGLQLDNDADVLAPDLAASLPRVALVALHFPKWTDGRAHTQARLLRTRLAWRGDLRATGEVLVDMAPLLWRNGFSSAVLRADQDPADARRALAAWTAAPGAGGNAQGMFPGPYQADARTRPGPRHHVPAVAPGSAFALHARERPGHAERVATAVALLEAAAREHPGAVVQASSLGAEDMVVTDLIVRHRLPIPVGMIDTGRLHPETLALRETAQAHWGMAIELHRPPQHAVLAFVTRHGPWPMYESPALRRACCALRKLQPLQALLAGRSAWITGLRREQSTARGAVPARDADDAGRIKFNPLADWHIEDVWQYLRAHRVPYHPLHDAFMPSIGCAPCTRAITPGEDVRAGRWWWEQDGAKECGLHAAAPAATGA